MPLNKLQRIRDPHTRDFVHEVKDLFLEQYKQEQDLYYKEDVKQVENLDFLVQRCIIHKKKNIKESLNSLIAMLKWRKEHRLREMSDYDFPIEYHMLGAAFLYEPDKFGNRTLYVRLQYLKFIPELRASLKEYMAYLMYRIDDSVNGESWSVIFDLTNASWNNYDLELLMHLITLLREYFPVSLDYALAINFPWVLSAAWVLAKRLIPPEKRDIVMFISDKEIFKYIDESNVPDFLGGTCKREYKLRPKTRQTTVEYLLSLKEPEVSTKRIEESIKALHGVLSDDHIEMMYKQLEQHRA